MAICAGLFFAASVRAQEKLKFTIEEECTAFAFGPDGRIVFSVRHPVKVKKYYLERADIWMASPEGKKSRILSNDKIVKTAQPFSFTVQGISWSPDGHKLAIEMLTDEETSDQGDTKQGETTELITDGGQEINVEGSKATGIPDSTRAQWLADGSTVVFLSEAVKPRMLYVIRSVVPSTGASKPLFEGHFFSAVAWDAKRNTAVAIERDRELSGPFKLVSLDLLKQTRRELASLFGYEGGLSLSPSGTKAGYYVDGDTIEIRDISSPQKAVDVRVGMGRFEWSGDEQRLLLKKGPGNRSGDLVWVHLPDGNLDTVLHSLTYREFAISPDGRMLGVEQPGTRNLMLYSIP
ncbi:MAG: TolB family protein [Candidatus Acidiferrales bacterium]